METVLGLLKTKAVKAVYNSETDIDHDIIRYVFRGKGTIAADNKSMLYEKDDFIQFGLPPYWCFYLNPVGQGLSVEFPIKLRTVLRVSSKRYIPNNNGEGVSLAPLSPVEKVIITINRKACDCVNL